MSKGTTIISDLRSFFSENENNRAINAIMRVMECINIRLDQIGTEKKENCKFTNVQVLNLLVLFSFFVVRNAYRYSGSSLSRLFSSEKDMFYRFMNDGNIKWRKLLYAMNLQLSIAELFKLLPRIPVTATEILVKYLFSYGVVFTVCHINQRVNSSYHTPIVQQSDLTSEVSAE